MKPTIVSLFLLLFCLSTQAQNLNYNKEMERMVNVPNTPEAQAFAKYGNTAVSMYSGSPNISVPIYTIAGRELNLPISLSYDASGVKVAQLASTVGLNWNLNVGGRISRITNGMPDGSISHVGSSYSNLYNTSNISVGGNATNKTLRALVSFYLNPPSTFNSVTDAETYFKFLKDVSDNKLDTQPDYFSFSALGYSDHFVYDLDSGTFFSLDNPRTKVTATFSGGNNPYITTWIVTVDNGTKFYFTKAEKTKTTKDNLFGIGGVVTQEYNSSWLLTQIDSPNKKDIYQFAYTDLGLSNTQPDVLVTSATNQLDDNYPANTTSETLASVENKVSQQVLSQITHNGDAIVIAVLKSRNDFNLNSAIDYLQINKPDGGLLKKLVFNHSYFGDSGATDIFKKRLKLDNITIKSATNTLSSYVFDYFSVASVPSRESLSRDYLGLYNGESNTVLYPEVTVAGTYFSGADRSANITDAKIGTLQKITYPTKGYSEFTYGLHKTPYTAADISASVQDVTYGSLTVLGGTGSNNGCGVCCLDQYSSVNPNINSIAFNVTDAGNYEIEYTKSNGGDGEAYLFHRSSLPNKGTIAYDSVIDQSSCAELVTMTWSHLSGSNGDVVYLVPGTYQMQLVKEGTGSIYLKVHRDEVVSNATVGTGAVSRAGLRIETIKDYDHSSTLVSEKEYKYTTTLNGTTSSGEMVFEPTYYTTSNYQVHIDSPDTSKGQVSGMNTLTTMTRVGSWSGGDRPHVAYSKVFEVQKATGEDNGYVEHNFNVGWYNGVFSTGLSPGANLYRNDFDIGKESDSHVYKAGNTLMQSDSTFYQNPQYFGNSTLYAKNNPADTFKYVNIYETSPGSGEYTYSYEPAVFLGFTYSVNIQGNGSNPAQPTSCVNCMGGLDYASISTLQTYAQGRIGGVLSSNSTSFNGATPRTQSSDNTYDTSGNYLLRSSETTNSKGETLSSSYFYPEDFTGLPYTTMVTENRVSDVIQTQSSNGSTILSTQRTFFTDHGDAILPNKIQTAKGGVSSLEDRILFEEFVDDNLVEVKQVNGSTTTYIWGYDKRYVVAKIENATYANVEALAAFGVGFSITNGLSGTQDTALRTLTDALVTTYEYETAVGVTSITDANGQTVTYHYDEFNRLEYVKDKNAKILSHNQYNYKN